MTDAPASAHSPEIRRGRRAEVVILALAFMLVNLAGAAFQKPYYFHDDQGWEGVSYLSVAQQVADGHFPVADDAPEVYRLGGLFLTGMVRRWTGWSLLDSFKAVNGTANALTLVLLVFWLRRFLSDWRVRVALCLAFLLQWDAPNRWMYFFPPHTDPWMWAFLLAGLLAVERYRELPSRARLGMVIAVTVIGVCFREIVFVIACILPFTGNPIQGATLRERWRDILPRLLALPAALLAMAALRLVAKQANSYSFAWTAAHWLYDKPWPTYVQSWFSAFGPILWLVILLPGRGAKFLARHQHLVVYLAAFAVLADIGGSDTERFLYWSMPVIYVLVGRALEDAGNPLPGWLLAILAGAQLIASRAVFWPIPDYPNEVAHVWPIFTPFARSVPFNDLFSDTEARPVSLVTLAEYLMFGAALGGWYFWSRRKTRVSDTASRPDLI